MAAFIASFSENKQANNNIIPIMQPYSRNWIQLSHHTLIEKSKITAINSSLKSLPIDICYTAIAQNSGPIAILVDRSINHQFILPDRFASSIIIFSCKGELKKLIPYVMKDRIIYFAFSKWEELIVVDAVGDYWIVDPYSGYTMKGTLIEDNSSGIFPNKERFRGCELLPTLNKLLLLKQKQLIITQSLSSTQTSSTNTQSSESPSSTLKYTVLTLLKINLENPIFSFVENGQSTSNEFVYLSKNNSIQLYDVTSNRKTTLCSDDSYLNENADKLLLISYCYGLTARKKLALVFSKPSMIVVKNVNKSQTEQIYKIQPMINLEYEVPTGLTFSYTSRSSYKSMRYQLYWMTGSSTINVSSSLLIAPQSPSEILVFCNSKLLLLSDGTATHLSPYPNSSLMITQQQRSTIRVYNTEQNHEMFRIVPYLYQTLVEIGNLKITEGHHYNKYLKIIHLHDQYTSYVEKDTVVDLATLSSIGNGYKKERTKSEPELDEESEQEQNPKRRTSMKFLPESNQPQQLDSPPIELVIETQRSQQQSISYINQAILQPLIETVKFCLDPVDQFKLFKFICFVKNYYSSQLDISDLCSQFRVVNNLKFEHFNRYLTLTQFEKLKYEKKEVFLTILLRYNMHFIADTIFGDTVSKMRIFLHWAKCKIEKCSEALAFEEIKDKYKNLPKKYQNSSVFTEIAKYCTDRNKLSLAENCIGLEENNERRIMVELILLVAKQDKKMVEKIMTTAENCSRSSLIYRVIKELLEAKWVDNYLWINIIHGKPNVERHFIKYLQETGNEELLKNYYLQQKKYEELGYFALSKIVNAESEQDRQNNQFDEVSLNIAIEKAGQFQKLVPNLTAALKGYKKNPELDLLRRAKSGEDLGIEEIKSYKNEKLFEYLGEIFFQQEKTDLAIETVSQIKETNVYGILQRKGHYKEAIQLAFQRKDKASLQRINTVCPVEFEPIIADRLQQLQKK